MATLTRVGREDALRITRVVELRDQLVGAVLAAMEGATPMGFASLAEVEAFLVSTTGEEVAARGTQGKIHHVDPRMLVSWVRDTIGDAELAASLDVVVDSERPYFFLVPEMKQLIAERLAQCEAAQSQE